jgi:hypothetical protein
LYYLQGVPGAPGPEGQMGAKGDMVMLHHKLKYSTFNIKEKRKLK